MTDLRRREFIALLGGAAAWPLAARAQQPAMPVIGFLSARSPYGSVPHVAAFRQGLAEAGFVDGRNLQLNSAGRTVNTISFPFWRPSRRPTGGSDRCGYSSCGAGGQGGTKTIPIVFTTMLDPAKAGLIESLNRPGGNATGAYTLATSLEGKQLEPLHKVVPQVARIAVLANPHFLGTELELKDLQEAARILGLELLVLEASSEGGITAAFATIVEQRIGALLVASDPFFFDQREQLVALTARHAIPAIFFFPEFARAGGLMAYGTGLANSYRQAGVYVGRILKGEKPADLPILQSTKIELIINSKTAQALGLTFPTTLLANEVIE